jgi:hypothetical protein
MNSITQTTAIVVVAATAFSSLLALSIKSQHTAANRTQVELAADHAAQRETSETLKRFGDKALQDERDAQAARALAHSQTPQARKLEALHQDDLRALQEENAKLPARKSFNLNEK